MATENVQELMFRLRVADDEINQQFVQVSRTLNENLARINRARNIINLQTQVDLQGLDAATDATRIFEVRQRSLQSQIENQRQRLNLLSMALRDTAERTGEDSDATQRARIQYEQARLSVARLERQLQRLNDTQANAGSLHHTLLERAQNAVNEIGGTLRNLEKVQQVMGAIVTETTALVERFKELEKQSFELNMPFEKSKDFLMQLKLAGGEIGDFQGYIRGITDAFVKGEVDDPEFIALAKYGAKITDANGRLKDFAAITEEVYQTYLKAKAAGEEIEFLQLTGGESGVTDAIQFFERYGEAKKDAAKVFKSGVDPEELHKAERALNLLTVQFEELRDATADLFTPAMTESAEVFFDVFRVGTELVKDNKETLRDLGSIIAGIVMPVDVTQTLKNIKTIFGDAETSAESLDNAVKDLNKTLDGKGTKGTDDNPLSQYAVQRIQQFKDELEELRIELDYDDDYDRQIAELNLWRDRELTRKLQMSAEERAAIEALYNAKLEKIQQDRANKEEQILKDSKSRTKALLQETADIIAESTVSEYERQVTAIERWRDEQLKAIRDVERELGKKGEFVSESVAVTVNAMAKETAAFEREMDKIRGRTQSLAEKIFEQQNSQRNIDIMRAQKERAEYYEEGIYPAEMIEEWFQGEMSKIADRVKSDKNLNYRKTPTHYTDNEHFIDAFVPDEDFYGDIQNRVNQALSQVGSPAYELQKQHQEIQQSLAAPLENIGIATDKISAALQDAASTIENFNQRISDLDFQQPQQLNPPTNQKSDVVGTAFDVTSSIGDLIALSGAATGNAPVALLGTGISAFSNLGNTAYNIADIKNGIQNNNQSNQLNSVNADINAALDKLTIPLQELSQRTGDIATSVETIKSQKPTITVNVSPSIDLGGAYVFDDAMKLKLTDDVSNEVVQAVTDAFEQALNQSGYAFGN